MPLSSDTDGILSAFRGIAHSNSAARPRMTEGRPQKIGKIGSLTLKKLDINEGGARDMLGLNWHLVIPPNLCERCSFESVRRGTLTICAQNAAVKQQLLFVSRGILKNAQTFVPDIKKIRII